jgi:ABC-type branched-subunit amino acid transport system ATPase component/ABC-type branched-subunit amino acid transport system permease subunit
VTLSGDIVVIGALTGLTYAVMAAGLVLVYRATKVINFAHGEIGAFGAAVLAKLVLDHHWNWFVAFLMVLAIGGLLGAIIERTVVRRLSGAPRVVLLVATIGVAQLVFFLQAILPDISRAVPYPAAFQRTMHVAGVLLQGQHFMAIAVVPAVMVGLGYFLTRTPWGVAIRATASNHDSARLAGIDVNRVSTLVWVLAGVLATAAVVIANPIRGVLVGGTFAAGSTVTLGPSLLLRALAAALVGRMTSLPLALAGGVGIGVVEAVLLVNVSSPRLMDFVLFLAVLVLVLGLGRSASGEGEAQTWQWTARTRRVPLAARANRATWMVAFALAVLMPFVLTSSARLFLFTRVLVYALVGLSVVIALGWAGQLSLCQFAFVGLGAVVTASLHQRGMPFGPAVACAATAGTLAAIAVGLPALRVKGLFLAVTTLAFAIAAGGYVLTHSLFFGDTTIVSIPRGHVWFIDLESGRTYYFLCLAVFTGAALSVAHVRTTGVGRRIIAVRDNEEAAASFSVPPALAKLTAFGLAGALAGLAGGLLAGLQVQVSSQGFQPQLSLEVVAMTIIGGTGSVAGAVLGALYVVGLPSLFDNSPEVRLLTSGVGLLVLLLYVPGGLLQILHRARDLLLGIAGEDDADGIAEVPVNAAPATPATGAHETTAAASEPVLRVEHLTVRFGGLTAVNDVTLDVNGGEIIGLIGSNGAGKSTLMNAISGFVRTAGGSISAFGSDITSLPAHRRAQLGLGRVFQDARLFPELTVLENVLVALEREETSELVPSLLALPPSIRAERRKVAAAIDVTDRLGLHPWRDTPVAHLSTGTRRIAELACLLALDTRVLLLDEPTAGVAQREAEAFGPLIQQIRTELDATVLLIEHDMPLVMALSDRIYCLSAGAVIAEGPPKAIRRDPLVIASYLGTDERAIRRSGRKARVKT